MFAPFKKGPPPETTRTGFPQVCASIQEKVFLIMDYIASFVILLLTNLIIFKGLSFLNSNGNNSIGQF